MQAYNIDRTTGQHRDRLVVKAESLATIMVSIAGIVFGAVEMLADKQSLFAKGIIRCHRSWTQSYLL